MLFILLCMVAHLTITWLVETIPTANQRALCWWLLKLPWREKARYYLKEKKNLDRNCCQKWHYILLMVVSWKYKQWSKSSDLFKCKNNYYSFLHGLQLLKRIYFKRFWFQHGFSLLVSSVGLLSYRITPRQTHRAGPQRMRKQPIHTTTLHNSRCLLQSAYRCLLQSVEQGTQLGCGLRGFILKSSSWSLFCRLKLCIHHSLESCDIHKSQMHMTLRKDPILTLGAFRCCSETAFVCLYMWHHIWTSFLSSFFCSISGGLVVVVESGLT